MDTQPPHENQDAARLLAEAESASENMLAASSMPRGFAPLLAFFGAVLLTFTNNTPWQWILACAASLVVLVGWGIWHQRRYGKPRAPLGHTSLYSRYVIGLIAISFGAHFWDPATPFTVLLKALVIFGLLWLLYRTMQRVDLRDRVKDAHERAH